MEIQYSLSESDILALYKYRLNIDPNLKRRYQSRRWMYLVGFALLGVAGYVFVHDVAFLIFSLIIAGLFYTFFPFYFNWMVRRGLASTYKQEGARQVLEKRTLQANPEGLLQIASRGESFSPWDEIDDLGVSSTHAFISVNERSSWYIIPRLGLVFGDFDAFIDEIRSYLEQPAEAIIDTHEKLD
jgi:hypothetical protein